MSFKYFENRDCEYYPCHKCEHINCLFCFCPLYRFSCDGNFKMIKTKDGKEIKDCSDCLVPHQKSGYDYIIKKLAEIDKLEGK